MSIAKNTMQGGLSAMTSLAINGGVAAGLSAAGTTQGTATALALGCNTVTTVASSSGVILPAGNLGDEMWVFNNGANSLTVYPPTSAKINAGSTNAGVSIGTATVCVFKCVSATQWIANLSA